MHFSKLRKITTEVSSSASKYLYQNPLLAEFAIEQLS